MVGDTQEPILAVITVGSIDLLARVDWIAADFAQTIADVVEGVSNLSTTSGGNNHVC